MVPLDFFSKPESKKPNLKTAAFIKRNLELKIEKNFDFSHFFVCDLSLVSHRDKIF